MVPVVSVLALVVLVTLTLACIEVPSESWLASRWLTFAGTLTKIKVISFWAVFDSANTTASFVIPNLVFRESSVVSDKASIGLWQALALAGFWGPEEIGNTWEIGISES